MIIQSAWQLSFDFFGSKPVVVEPSAVQVSSDAGLLPFRQLDERLGLSRQFAEALTDRRRAGLVDHPFLEMARRGSTASWPTTPTRTTTTFCGVTRFSR